MNLIHELESEHLEIIRLVREIKTVGIRTMAGRNILSVAIEKLMTHLERENRLLYPEITRASDWDAETITLVQNFKTESATIMDFARSFLEKYTSGDSGFDFQTDFPILYASLMKRIEKEEQILYPVYLNRPAAKGSD